MTNSGLAPEEKVPTAVEREMRQIGIPPRPSILDTIRHEMEKDEPNFNYLATVIGSDVSLAAGLIKTANSPYIGLRTHVRSVREAMMALGLNLTSHTIAGLALRQIFGHMPSLERFWDFSTLLANTNGWLAHRVGDISGEDAYTFGLFRDCGIPVMMAPFRQEYPAILRAANEEARLSFTEIEDTALGMNHADIGADLTASWLLPSEISQGVRHHHDLGALAPDSGLPRLAKDLIATSHLAEFLIQTHTGLSHTREWPKMGRMVLEYLGVPEEDLGRHQEDYAAVAAGEH